MTTIWKNKVITILNTNKSIETVSNELFDVCDQDKSGRISFQELKELIKVNSVYFNSRYLMKELFYLTYFLIQVLQNFYNDDKANQRTKKVMHEFDGDASGKLDRNEFNNFILSYLDGVS